MNSTSSSEIIVKDPEEVKNDAIISITVIISITLLFIGYYVYSSYIGIENTIYVRLKKYYGSSLSQLSLGLVVVFLVSDVVNAFNTSIIFPIIKSSFPDENIWNQGVTLPRGQIMYPGLFLQAIVSFVLSVAIMFMVGELFSIISKFINRNKVINPKELSKKTSELYIKIGYIFVMLIFFGLIIWNIVEIINPSEETIVVNYQSPRFIMI